MFWAHADHPGHPAIRLAVLCAAATLASAAADNAPKKALFETADARVSIEPRAHRAPEPHGTISVSVNLVLIPVTVTDLLEQPQLGLKRETFRLFEDGIEQNVESLAVEHAPLSLGIVFDSSGSMTRKMAEARQAVERMLDTSVPGDEYFLIDFNNRPRIVSDFTASPEKIRTALSEIRSEGWTALIDAIYLAVNEMKHASNSRRAILVLSDGADNHSRYRQGELRGLLRESSVSLYAVGILGQGIGAKDMKLLSGFAEDTGGRLFTAEGLAALPDTIDKVNTALRDQYVLGYRPTNGDKDGKFRRVQVKLNTAPDSPPLRASWRTGYYAPD